MNRGLIVVLLSFLSTCGVQSWAAGEIPESAFRICVDCHPAQVQTYQHSRMAVAAITPGFLHEWRQKGSPDQCFRCHAPSGGKGVACIDCHLGARHPYASAADVRVCARCHDAMGEIAVRSYLSSPAARRGQNCGDCHLQPSRYGHEFLGPSTAGFLDGIARLGVSLRRDGDDLTALVRIRHSAGHALPGGTTGRAVWLVVDEIDTQGRIVNSTNTRFGWLYLPRAGWRHNTLSAGRDNVVEVAVRKRKNVGRLHVKLIYRFTPGDLKIVDKRQVVLDELVFNLARRKTDDSDIETLQSIVR